MKDQPTGPPARPHVDAIHVSALRAAVEGRPWWRRHSRSPAPSLRS